MWEIVIRFRARSSDDTTCLEESRFLRVKILRSPDFWSIFRQRLSEKEVDLFLQHCQANLWADFLCSLFYEQTSKSYFSDKKNIFCLAVSNEVDRFDIFKINE